jgi:hypothetical protein
MHLSATLVMQKVYLESTTKLSKHTYLVELKKLYTIVVIADLSRGARFLYTRQKTAHFVIISI